VLQAIQVVSDGVLEVFLNIRNVMSPGSHVEFKAYPDIFRAALPDDHGPCLSSFGFLHDTVSSTKLLERGERQNPFTLAATS
jgi:hypothetical protein